MHILGCTMLAVYKVKQLLLIAICSALCLGRPLWQV